MSIEQTMKDMQQRIEDLIKQRDIFKKACDEILYTHANDNYRPKAFYIAAKAVQECKCLYD